MGSGGGDRPGVQVQQRHIVAVMLYVLVLTAFLIPFSSNLIPELPDSVWPSALILLFAGLGWWLLKRDELRLAVGLVNSAFFLTAAIPVLNNGLSGQATGLTLFFIPLALAGMVQDRLRLLLTAAGCIGTVFLSVWLHSADLLGPPDGLEPVNAMQGAVEFTIACVIVTVILERFGRANRRVLEASLQRETALARAMQERELAEHALERERYFSNAIIDNLPGIFVVFDETGETIRGNSNISSEAGYEHEEANDLPVEAFVAREDIPMLREKIGEALRHGRARATVSLQHRDGRFIPYLFQGSSFLMEGRQNVVALGYDVSEVVEARRAIEELNTSLELTNTELLQAYETTIEGWSRALDLRDHETEGHSQRVTDLTVQLAGSLGATAEQLLHVRRGALLHDIGKMGVPDSILLKPGALTDEERAAMQMHPIYAYELLKPIRFLEPALAIPLYHHENWDGTGYPKGLAGEDIPLAARVFAVVDVFDALTSERPYRPAWSRERALEHIKGEAGKRFDPKVVSAFISLLTDSPAIIHP